MRSASTHHVQAVEQQANRHWYDMETQNSCSDCRGHLFPELNETLGKVDELYPGIEKLGNQIHLDSCQRYFTCLAVCTDIPLVLIESFAKSQGSSCIREVDKRITQICSSPIM